MTVSDPLLFESASCGGWTVALLGLLLSACWHDPHPEGRHSSVHISADGGATWKTLGGPFKGDFLQDLCLSGDGALAVGNGPAMLSVTPRRWRTLSRPPLDSFLYAVWCDGEDIIAGGDRPALLTSHDAGRSWSVIPAGVRPGSWLQAIRSVGQSIIAVGQQGALLRSDDRGRSWTAKNVGPDSFLEPRYDFNDVWGTSPGDLILVGERHGGTGPGGAVTFRTTDFGKTLTPVPMPTDFILRAFWSDGRGLVIAVGSGGAIVRSTDKGAHFALVESGTNELLHDVWGDGHGTVLAVGSRGTALRSVDNGASFVRVDAGTPHNLDAIVGKPDGTVFLIGSHPSAPIPHLW